MKLYISDLHFFHDKIITLDKRPFADSRSMNQYIIEKWNKKVQGGDQIIVLGDMFWTKDASEVNAILNRLKGKICLIEGNHDKMWLSKEGVNLNRFEWIKPYSQITDGKNIVIASHYPTFCYDHQFLKNDNGTDRTYMLYGHVHNTHDEILVNQFITLTKQTVLQGSSDQRKIPCNMINCFCGFCDYTPLSLNEWIKVDSERRSKILLPENQIIKDEL
ncbi:MAG: metallophosphoesterase family protein [Treponema sp.]|nr:metallophosphoesterase family protein [Treponema sp.]MDY5124510.1 metallophosphoesterase family protein [Treponema sp.]